MNRPDQKEKNSAFSGRIPTIPDHEVLRCIGHGSYGDVWLARNLFGIYRAVKVVYRDAFKDERPFERELAGIHRFEPISRSHEGFVDVLQIGRNEAGGYFYYVMELGDDRQSGQNINPEIYAPRTLGRDVLGESRLPTEGCLQLGLSLSNALSQLHKQKLVHRDIKPSNIIFVNGIPKLADIGLVAEIKEAQSYVGTEGFFPPEGPGTPQADIFSLGKVLYEISTGEDRHAFPRLPAACQELATDPQFQELNEVILRACQNDVRRRYQTADEMYADLSFLLNGKSVKRLRLLERRFGQLRKLGAAAAVFLVLAGFGYYQIDREKKHRAEIRQREIGGHTAYGLQALEEGQFMSALPSFIEVLRLDRPQRAPMHRVRLSMILEQCPKLPQMWPNSDQINDGQFSPDGRLLVLASQTNQVQVFDVETGEAMTARFGPNYFLGTACFSPDGARLLVASQDRTATLWDWRSGGRAFVLKHPERVMAARFNNDGTEVITACFDGIARLWDSSNGKLLLPLKRQTEPLLYAAFGPDDKLIVTTSRDNSALIWDRRNGKAPSRTLLHKNWVTHAAFSPDGLRVATAGLDHTARVWNVATGEEVFPPLTHRDGVSSVEFSPDGRLILTGCWDSTARLWDATTGKPFYPNPVLRHTSRVLHASFHPDGHRIITTCLDGTSRLWDLAASSTTAPAIHASFSPGGNKFLAGSKHCLEVRETLGSKPNPPIELPLPLTEASWSRNGRFLLTLSGTAEPEKKAGGELALWEIASGKRLFWLSSFSEKLDRVGLSDDGHRMVRFWTNAARVDDLPSGQPLSPLLVHKRAVQSAAFSFNGESLLTISRNQVYVWNPKMEKPRFVLDHPINVEAARFSDDDSLIVTCSLDDQFTECAAQVWDASTGSPLGQPLKHRDGVLSAAFSPDHRRVVTASEDFTALIWDLVERGEPTKLQHNEQVHEACFNPSGSWVLTVSRDQTARLWDAESGEPLSPPLPHPSSLWHGVFLDDHSFVTSDNEGNSWLWKITTNSYPVGDLKLIAEILNGTRPSAKGPGIAQETSYDSWRKMKAKYPADFMTTHEELLAWHRQQAALSKEEGRWRAALFHYDHLLALEPADQAVIQLRAEALREQAAKEHVPLVPPGKNGE